MDPSTVRLPRLLYAGDVPVEASVAGSLLLHRLLGGYPVALLCIAYGDQQDSRPELRLHGCSYLPIRTTFFPRLARTRFHRIWKIVQALVARFDPRPCRRLEAIAREQGAEAILTVVHGSAWIAAARVARSLGLPLYLIVHDDLIATMNLPSAAMAVRRWLFGGAYRQAAARLCVSPGMAEQYEREFGIAGTVLYPSRGDDSPQPRLRTRRRNRDGGLVIAYAGSLWIAGYVRLIAALAQHLAPLGGRMELYTPGGTEIDPRPYGLNTDNVVFRPFLPPAELCEHIAITATALFSPASFDATERFTIGTLFPSKLVDYSAMGLPILIWGPAHSSAVRWAREFPDAAAVCEDQDGGESLRQLLERLRDDAAWSDSLAVGALRAGERCFSLEGARRVLLNALVRDHGLFDSLRSKDNLH